MSNKMYGSVHTHFESQYDTANDLQTMVCKFLANGAKRVVATEHGVFSSFEDLNDIVRGMKKKIKNFQKRMEAEGISLMENPEMAEIDDVLFSFNWHSDKISEDEWNLLAGSPEKMSYLCQLVSEFQIIPGVEGYFGPNNAHLILGAKDFEGYLSLCKIISESNRVLKDQGGKHPVITLENLRENVSKGHIFATSACIAGPFGHIFGLDTVNLDATIQRLEEEFAANGYLEYHRTIEDYETAKAIIKENKVLKREWQEAEKDIKKLGDDTLMQELQRRDEIAKKFEAYIEAITPAYNEAIAAEKRLNKGAMTRKLGTLEKAREEREKLSHQNPETEADVLLAEFREIFGDENFFLEIQNHDMHSESVIYNNIIQFALSRGFTNFIASNDIHIGTRKTDADYEEMLKKRNVIKFTRFNKYEEETADDREYVIKSDEELRAELLKMVKPVAGVDIETEVIDKAIGNIEFILSQCDVQFKKENHYPKFCDDEAAEFERKVREGIKLRFPKGFPDEEMYSKRLEYELDVIKRMGYSGYHLIVADYLEYGRLLGYLPTEEEVENAPSTVEELDRYITEKGYPRIGYNIGPGRGSAVGSLCCYALGITDIDPIPYNLLFERFLNVERISMPDIDSDFRTDVRAKVIDYCKTRYGAECICQIMTKAYGAPKGNLRLAARYLGAKEFTESNPDIIMPEVETELPVGVENSSEEELETMEEESAETLIEMFKPKTSAEKEAEYKKIMKRWYDRADALAKQFDELKDFPDIETLDETDTEIVELAKILDGVFTNYGQHAAGTIISGDDVREILPLMWNSKKGSMETQCTMAQAEAKGLLKMDFLGLNNLDIITAILRHPSVACFKEMAKNLPSYVDSSSFSSTMLDSTLQDYIRRDEMLKDKKIFQEVFWTGLTQGVFQFESPGMKKMLMEFKPETFEDIILLVAAYRPGPMQYLDEIIKQKQYDDQQAGKEFASEEKIGKIHKPTHSINIQNETLKDILSPTYGCIIYQEQVMQIFQYLAGYSLGGADLVRRAMSKKHLEELIPERAAFIFGDPERGIEGCIKKQGISEADANTLFDQMMDFASYAFNKSHATAYAMVAMFTAYLKTYHTADFFRESLNAVKKLDEIPAFVQEMPEFGLEMLPPSMMKSQDDFSVSEDGRGIYYGLHYVKGFSSQEGVQKRESVQEFIEANPQVSLKTVTKYAQLGMFRGAWAKDLIHRPNCTRHEILRMLEENGETLKKYYEQAEKVAGFAEQMEELGKRMVEEGTPELEAELKKVTKSFTTWTEKRKETAAVLNDHFKRDMGERSNLQPETSKEIMENRKWEIEFLSLPFTYEESMAKVKASPNTHTFEDLKKSISENYGSTTIRVPVVILSVSDRKTAKSGNSTYFDVLMMDRNGSYLTRRFDTPPDFLEGEFALTLNECRYYTCRTAQGRALFLPEQVNKEYASRTMNSQEKAQALARGARLSQLSISGNRGFQKVTVNQEQMESDGQDEHDDI